jgi:N-methylhydantoinase B/oxoprolinase/acetone carboxylase alpha subunit
LLSLLSSKTRISARQRWDLTAVTSATPKRELVVANMITKAVTKSIISALMVVSNKRNTSQKNKIKKVTANDTTTTNKPLTNRSLRTTRRPVKSKKQRLMKRI